ncbi:MAG: hypothetical protein Ct9H90mP16_07760 [Candidatus Poseidoniales archaeon]|nr:MAG: hypothetical protein Ct9H90mP16_07760 [Candidatus Poseidoniales archaeon]
MASVRIHSVIGTVAQNLQVLCLGPPGGGCPMPVGDEDGDNVADEDDLCPDSPEGERSIRMVAPIPIGSRSRPRD